MEDHNCKKEGHVYTRKEEAIGKGQKVEVLPYWECKHCKHVTSQFR